MEEVFILTMVAGLISLIFILIGLGITSYIFGSMALMEIGKRRGEENSWLAWIPYAREYFFGKVAYQNTTKAVIYILVNVLLPYAIAFMSAMIVIVFTLLDMELFGEIVRLIILFIEVIGLNIYRTIVANKIFKLFKKDTTGYIILSILVPCALEIILYRLRKKEFIVEGKTINE